MMTEPLLTFIAPMYMESEHNRMFIDSMLNQTDKNWKAIIIHNGPNEQAKEQCSNIDPRITYMESVENTGNWGTKNRQWGIDICDTSWIVQSSIQDVWLPQAVEYINSTIVKYTDSNCIVWDSINHIVGPCQKLEGALAWSKCDWGQFTLKTWIAKKVGIKRGDIYCGDWAFVQDCLSSGYIKNTVKLNGILTIHN